MEKVSQTTATSSHHGSWRNELFSDVRSRCMYCDYIHPSTKPVLRDDGLEDDSDRTHTFFSRAAGWPSCLARWSVVSLNVKIVE